MNQVDEAGLAAFLDAYIEGKYGRLLKDRCFQAYITQVSPNWPFKVAIQRVGDGVPDPSLWACPVPHYFPVPGDLVEMIWRDDRVFEVLAPLSQQMPEGRLYQGSPNGQAATPQIRIPTWANHLRARITFTASTNPSTFQITYNACVAYAWELIDGQAGNPSASNSTPIAAFRCGVYNNTLGWPTEMDITMNNLQSALQVRPIKSIEDRIDGAGNQIFAGLNTGYGTTVEAVQYIQFTCSAGTFGGDTRIDVYGEL